MTIYEKLQAISSELFVPKNNRNDFGKFNYRSCEDILSTVKPLLTRYKCALTLDNNVLSAGDRIYIQATATLFDLESDKRISTSAQAREEESKKGMDSSQVTGAASSYARKYALAGLFCIDNEKDSDATNVGDESGQPTTRNVASVARDIGQILNVNSKPVTGAQIAHIRNLMHQKNISLEQICERFKVKKLEELSYDAADSCIRSLNNTK